MLVAMMDPSLFFKNLSDETRLKIVLLVYVEQEICVCELTHALALSQPKISRHLAQLKSSGLISGRREGKWVFYALAKNLAPWQRQTIALSFQANQHYIRDEQNQLTTLGQRPKRQQQCCD